MRALIAHLRKREVDCRFGCPVESLHPFGVTLSDSALADSHQGEFDVVLDCRGVEAQPDLPTLRAVRGELLVLETHEARFNRPIRLLHPRYPLYLVPRPDGKLIVGATSIESSDLSPLSVRSTLELLSAAYSVCSSLSEARVIETRVGLRPAFPDHLPRIQYRAGLIRINGLYRHGYLISPVISQLVCELLSTGKPNPTFAQIYEEMA